ncbi:MAG: serine/threonine protein kinase, partial [Vicinamibacterales bacterium]
MRWGRRVVGVAAVLAVASGLVRMRAAGPEDWSRFRGPNGSGISETGDLPLTFGPEENVIWKT